MSNAEFDRHANEYYKQHEQNIQISGEDPEYFAEYKMRDFKSLIVEANLPMEGNYLDFGSGIGAS
ncbi:MAG: class I SAM-dependent methyltransferase, partial [Azonexus sp.]